MKRKLLAACLLGAVLSTNTAMAAETDTVSENAAVTVVDTTVAEEEAKVLEVDIEKYQVNYIDNVAYRQIWDGKTNRQLEMNLMIPKLENETPAPVVIYIKGSGFTAQNLEGFIQQKMYLAEAGYAVVSVEGRMVPEATFPASIIDFKAAVRYLRAHAEEYNLNTDKIAVWGDSSGGYAACMLGTTNGMEDFEEGDFLEESSDVACVIDFYGPTDLTTIGQGLGEEVEAAHLSPATTEALLVNGTAFPPNAGGGITEYPEKAAAANPITYIDETDPEFLIIHGDADTLVSPYQSKVLYQALKEHNVPAELYIVPGAGHGSSEFYQSDVMNLVLDFLNKKLQ